MMNQDFVVGLDWSLLGVGLQLGINVFQVNVDWHYNAPIQKVRVKVTPQHTTSACVIIVTVM